ncbi:MAG: hypothetical protein E7530_01750 [Ruminococcaceae bacterium]|nr:hypothetical protein [Oscillospiraceae bacterium]
MIGITVEKAHGEYDPGTSKFFGAPTMPEEWLSDGTINDEDFFFCQLKISELKKFDKDGLLPQKGFIYIFLSFEDGKFIPNIRYCNSEPDTLIDDFNAGFDFLGDTDTEYSIDYFETDSAEDGTRLIVENDDTVILLQYDPLDDNMPSFLADTEKIAYISIAKDNFKKLDFTKAEFYIK